MNFIFGYGEFGGYYINGYYSVKFLLFIESEIKGK